MSQPRSIWVDADACPVVIRDILIRAAERAKLTATFVANHWVKLPASPWLRSMQVAGGFDVADGEIVDRVQTGDLVVTQDIPLAAAAIERGATALSPRGEPYNPETIAERLAMRNFMEELRGAGVQTGGHATLHARDRQAFAARLDAWIAKTR